VTPRPAWFVILVALAGLACGLAALVIVLILAASVL
jgi:hypothetical protein